MYNKPFKEELAAYRRQKVKQINDTGNPGPGIRRRFCNPFHHFKPPEGPPHERGDATIPTFADLASNVHIEPCHQPVQDLRMSFYACDSHPKMLYRVAAIYSSVTEAGVFPY
jgi:hypothetical protein